MNEPPRVAVVGGGLAGLVAARHLAAAGADVTCFERRDRVGGRVRTVERDGFRFDRGFQVLFTGYPAVRAELDLEALDLRRFSPGAVLAKPGHRSTLADPLRGPRALPETLLNREITVGDKLRTLLLRLELARTTPDFDRLCSGPDATIDTFLRGRGFSDQFIERFAAPFYGGISLDRSLSTSKRVFEYTFAALARGDISVPSTGMGAISEQLAANARAAGATIETGVEVTAIDADGTLEVNRGGSGSGTDATAADTVSASAASTDTVSADAVVIATDPNAARELTGIDSIPTEARSCVTQQYRLPAGNGLGIGPRLLLNTRESGPNHVVPHSAVAPEYAPDSAALVSATYLGDREESDAQLAERTRETLAAWFPERRFDRLECIHTDRIRFAQFAQPPGVHDTLPDVRNPDGPVYLAGEYTRWSSIQGAIESGRQAAKAVAEDHREGSSADSIG